MRATLKNYRQSPRKVRLVADFVRGKSADRALTELDFVGKRAAAVLKKLLNSAVAGAKHNFNTEKENLFIEKITVDKGPTLHRWRPRARGRAAPINKRTSNITVVLAQKQKSKTASKNENIKSETKA